MKAGWERKKLADLCERITKGSSPKWQGISYVNEPGVLFVTSENVGECSLLMDKPKYVEEKFNAKEKKSILKNGDVLTNIVGASIGRTAIFDLDEVANINQAVCLLRCKPSLLNNYYLAYLLNSPFLLQVFDDNKVDTARANLSLGFFSLLEIPLPPLPEQQRIVGILDEAFDGIATAKANAERNLQNARALFESHLQSVFTQRGEGWVETTLGEQIRFIDYRGKTPEKTASGLRLITAKNVKMGYLQREPMEFVAPDSYDGWMTRGIPKLGDVLFTTEAPLANVAQLDTEDKVVFAQRIIIMQTDAAKLDSTYLKYLLLSQPVQQRIHAKGTGATVQGIKASLLKTIEISFPNTISEQQQIVTKLDALRDETQRLESIYQQKLAALDELKKIAAASGVHGAIVKPQRGDQLTAQGGADAKPWVWSSANPQALKGRQPNRWLAPFQGLRNFVGHPSRGVGFAFAPGYWLVPRWGWGDGGLWFPGASSSLSRSVGFAFAPGYWRVPRWGWGDGGLWFPGASSSLSRGVGFAFAPGYWLLPRWGWGDDGLSSLSRGVGFALAPGYWRVPRWGWGDGGLWFPGASSSLSRSVGFAFAPGYWRVPRWGWGDGGLWFPGASSSLSRGVGFAFAPGYWLLPRWGWGDDGLSSLSRGVGFALAPGYWRVPRWGWGDDGSSFPGASSSLSGGVCFAFAPGYWLVPRWGWGDGGLWFPGASSSLSRGVGFALAPGYWRVPRWGWGDGGLWFPGASSSLSRSVGFAFAPGYWRVPRWGWGDGGLWFPGASSSLSRGVGFAFAPGYWLLPRWGWGDDGLSSLSRGVGFALAPGYWRVPRWGWGDDGSSFPGASSSLSGGVCFAFAPGYWLVPRWGWGDGGLWFPGASSSLSRGVGFALAPGYWLVPRWGWGDDGLSSLSRGVGFALAPGYWRVPRWGWGDDGSSFPGASSSLSGGVCFAFAPGYWLVPRWGWGDGGLWFLGASASPLPLGCWLVPRWGLEKRREHLDLSHRWGIGVLERFGKTFMLCCALPLIINQPSFRKGAKMPQSLSSILIHLVFSTKHRESLITPDVETDLHDYMGGIFRRCECPSLLIGGTADHIHALFVLSRTKSVASVVEDVKSSSSKWIKTKGALWQNFHWQAGYGAFSVGQSGIEKVKSYIANQKQHHSQTTFQDEYRLLCKKYGVEIDEQYVWD